MTIFDTWRSKPYGAIGHLFILQPTPVFKARVNMAPTSSTYPVANIDYDGVTLGAYSDTEQGMTVTFGTTEGGDDLGRNRLRQAASAAKVRIALSSAGTNDGEVYIQDNAYITVWNDFRLWWKPPRIEPDGTEYMDYRFAVDDNNINTPPIANAGIGYAGANDTILLDSSASVVTTPGASIASREWFVGDDDVYISGSSSSTSPTVQFSPGFRWVKLVVTDSNGKTARTRIPVYIGDGNIGNFIVTNRRLTLDGQEISFVIREVIDLSDYPDGTLVMYWEEEWYAHEEQYLAGPTDREHMRFIGYLQKERTTINPLLAQTEITCVDVAQRLRTVPGFPWIVANADAPVGWSEMDNLNIDRYMHFILNWTTTAPEIAPFTWSGLGSTYVAAALDSNQGTPWEQVAEMAEAICHRFTCDSRGQLAIKRDPMFQDVVDRPVTEVVELTPDDYTDLQYDYNREPAVGWLDSAAVKARQDKYKAIIVQAPGAIPGQGDQQLTINHRLVEDGTEFRAQEGHRYARANSRYGDFTLRLLHPGYIGIEPANMDWIRVIINDFEGVRGRTINSRFLVKEVSYTYNHQVGQVECWLTLEKEITNGLPADRYKEPDETPTNNDDVIIFKPKIPVEVGENVVLAFDQGGNVLITYDFSVASPEWLGLGNFGDGAGSFLQFEEDPFSPYYAGTGDQIHGWILTQSRVIRVQDVLGAFTASTVLNFDANWRGHSMSVSKLVEGHVVVVSQKPTIVEETRAYYSVNGVDFEQSVIVENRSQTELYWLCGCWISEVVQGRVYATVRNEAADETVGYISENYGETWTLIVPATDMIYMESPYSTSAFDAGTHVIVFGEGNGDETRCYFARITDDESRLYRSNGASTPYATDITPENGADAYGPDPTARQSIGVSPVESDVIGLVGVLYDGPGTLPNFVDGDRGVFYSNDGGASWTTVVGTGSDVNYRVCRVYADGQMIIAGLEGAIALSLEGAPPSIKTGDLSSIYNIRDVWRKQ